MEFTKCRHCGASISVTNINEHEFLHEYGKVSMMVGDKMVLIKTREQLKELQKWMPMATLITTRRNRNEV